MTQKGVGTPEIFDAYLAEYNSLRSEVLARFQTQNQAFNFLLIVLGAAITAVISTANSDTPENLASVILSVALLLPLATCPLGYMFFDNELMIHAIGSYIYYDRRKKLESLTGHPHFFGTLTDFKHLPPSTNSVFHPISRGRWLLFCIPAFIPLLFTPLYAFTRWPTITGYSGVMLAAAAITFVFDLIACFWLARAVLWVFENARYQANLAEQVATQAPGKP